MEQRYSNYKSSGVEWIGEIPSHWKVSKIKFLPKEGRNNFIDGDWVESSVIEETGIRYITTGNIGEGYYKEQGKGFISEDTFEKLNCSEIFEGDLVISRLFLPIGRCCIIPNLGFRIITSVDNVILRPKEGIDKRYLVFQFNSKRFFEYTEIISRGSTLTRISRTMLGNTNCFIPPLPEQEQIVKYLDEKTSLIDNLISITEKKIEILKQKRTSLINEVVTKGLNRDVEMKDSGVEWIGEIPSHWEVRRLKSLSSIYNGSTPKSGVPEFWDGDIIWVTPSDISKLKGDFIENSERKITIDGFNNCGTNLVPAGTIILTTRAPIGNLVISNVELCTNQGCKSIQPRNIIPKLMYYFLLISRDELESLGSGTTFLELSTESLRNFQIVHPPLIEQEQIVEYIETHTTEIDNLVSIEQRRIDSLKEYRKSLISEVVTGKIKVTKEETTIKKSKK